MQRFLAFLIVVGVALGVVQPASADRLWCKTDPVVALNGILVDLSTAIPVEDVVLVNGPVRYVIKVPASVHRVVVLNDVGYGYGSDIVFEDGGQVRNDGSFDVSVVASIPTSGGVKLPMEVSIITVHPEVTLVSSSGTSHRTAAAFEIMGQ